jgi:hypothetical protein
MLEAAWTIGIEALVPFAGFRPALRVLPLSEHDLLESDQELMGASVRADSTDSRTESWKRDSANGELTVLEEQEDGAGGEVRIDGIAQYHGNSHGWCDDQERDGMVAGFYGIGLADQEFTVMARCG